MHPLTPSVEKTLIEFYTKAGNLPNTDMKGLRSWASAFSEESGRASKGSAGVWLSMVLPAIEAMISAEISEEDYVRWTRTAIGIRQYKNKKEKWPTRLRDLEEIGLTIEDYSNATEEVFGYEVDGDTAYIWTSEITGQSARTRIRAVRPTVASEYANGAQSGVDSLYYVLKLQ